MKVLVVGGGGREHALVWKLAQSSSAPQIFCAPGNAGTEGAAQNMPIPADDIAGLAGWASREKPDLTVVGPEAPLCAGLVDEFERLGLRVFGPGKAAARIEGSKVFSKELLVSAGVNTAKAEIFAGAAAAKSALKRFAMPVVVKADGLAAGKGVIICESVEQAEAAVSEIIEKKAFGKAGETVIIEEFLRGEELSVLALADGRNFMLLPAAQDHKRVYDNDRGPNTGGMGAYAPAPAASASLLAQVRERVFEPVFHELRRRGITYKGVLYAGLLIAEDTPFVLEFNCRFGDPETQAVLPLLQEDLLPLLDCCIDGRLPDRPALVHERYCVCVVMAAGGYPAGYRKGDVIRGLGKVSRLERTMVFHAGTARRDGGVATAGGRVLGVTGWGGGLADAAQTAYRAVSAISFADAHWRTDIALKGINRLKGQIP